MKRNRQYEAEMSAALTELGDIRDRLAAVRSEFQHSLDPMLVEANIHEMNALNARYGYLLRRMKELRDAAPGPRKRRRSEQKQ